MRWTSTTASKSSCEISSKRAVADVAGVVDEDIDAAEVIERGLNDRLAALRASRRTRCRRPLRRQLRGSPARPHRRGRHRCLRPCMLTPGSLTTTFAPFEPSSRAYSRPRPRPAPVITATRPSNLRSVTARSPSAVVISIRWRLTSSCYTGSPDRRAALRRATTESLCRRRR